MMSRDVKIHQHLSCYIHLLGIYLQHRNNLQFLFLGRGKPLPTSVPGVTGQLMDTPTRGLPTRGLDDSRTGHLADWSTRRLDNSRTGQVADWTTRGCHRRLCVLSFPFWRHLRDRELSSPRLVQSVSWLLRELSSPRDVQSASWQSASWHIRELSSYPHIPPPLIFKHYLLICYCLHRIIIKQSGRRVLLRHTYH